MLWPIAVAWAFPHSRRFFAIWNGSKRVNRESVNVNPPMREFQRFAPRFPRSGVIVLSVQKVTVWSKNPLRDNHLKIRPFLYRRPSGAGDYASGTLMAGRAVAARG